MMSSDFWRSPEGLAQRIGMFSTDFTFGIQNRALQVYGQKEDVWGFEVIGNMDSRQCDFCDGMMGRRYRLGQFMSSPPYHANCRCSLVLIPRGKE